MAELDPLSRSAAFLLGSNTSVKMGTRMLKYRRGTIIPGYGPPNDYSSPNADGALGGNPAFSPFLTGPAKYVGAPVFRGFHNAANGCPQ